MTALKERLLRRIALTGPLSIADYMTECLLHPEHGYYATRDPFGESGDFITPPQISQIVGECIGLALAQAWLDQGGPAPFVLAELGPGRGTLMADVLRVTRMVPGFHEAARVHLVEASPVLRAAQAEAIANANPTFHDEVTTLPEAPLFLLANEFFDALPIRQYIRDDAGWRERVVGAEGARLRFGLTDSAPIAALEPRWNRTAKGKLIEVSSAAQSIAGEIGRRIARNGGLAFFIDYGAWGGTGDTFQAVRKHKKVDPLADPGAADLTAHVDFRAIAEAVVPARASPLASQGVLLERLGITARARKLAASLSGDRLKAHIAAHRRLTHPDEMGSLFQVLAVRPDGAPCPPGMEP